MSSSAVILCPGQGAQSVGMGKAWAESSTAAAAVFAEAEEVLGNSLGGRLSEVCFGGPAELLNRTDISQPTIYTCSVACVCGLLEQGDLAEADIAAAAGLSLGEYTALHLAGAFGFAEGLRLVARRGELMQQAAENSNGAMVALIGADQAQAEAVCEQTRDGEMLVCANFNAPGQIVLSGHASACDRAVEVAGENGLRATPLTVAGAFHSDLMQPAADGMATILSEIDFQPLQTPVWSNVTARPHDSENMELLKQLLVEQIISPVRWAQSCENLISTRQAEPDDQFHELAPGNVIRGLMRRIDRNRKVLNHDQPHLEKSS